MFDWVQIAILALQLINKLVNWMHDRGMIDEGRRQVIAELAGRIGDKVKIRDEIRKEVDGKTEAEVDADLGGLIDPPGGGGRT